MGRLVNDKCIGALTSHIFDIRLTTNNNPSGCESTKYIWQCVCLHNWCFNDDCNVRHQQPTGIWTWVNSQLRVAIQHSNWLGQRFRLTSERLAGRLDCHILPFLNSTRHPCLATCHSYQARNMAISQLWVNYQCAGLYPGMQTSLSAPTSHWYSNLGW